MSTIAAFPSSSVIGTAASSEVLRFRPNQYLAHAQGNPSHLLVLKRGWAIRYRQLRDGRRQITGLFLPGDTCDVNWLGHHPHGQAIKAITDVEANLISRTALDRLVIAGRDPWGAIQNEMCLQAAIQSEQCLTLGRKTAAERLAQLFSEIWWRLSLSPTPCQIDCPMPLTQQDMADFSGLTPIHVNRVLREMRDANIIIIRARRMTVPDLGRLQRLAQFDPKYLTGLAGRRLHHLTTV
jgi:CRP-like cAMP-binding protein